MQPIGEVENRDRKRSAIILLHTPFQAWVVEKVLRAEQIISYDLLYFTHEHAPEDRHYFNMLADRAQQAQYFYAPIRCFQILEQLDFRWQTRAWFSDRGYDLTLLSSIHAFIPNAIAHRQTAELVTFDDGTANFYPQSIYFVDPFKWRSRIYRHLLGAKGLSSTKRRIARHYTLYPKFENIVERERLRTLVGWSRDEVKCSDGQIRTYFVGQPFEEAMAPHQIRAFEAYLRTKDIDFYILHPRERSPLNIGAPLMEKGGLIAEDAILRDAGTCRIHVIGWFSTVMFNLVSFTFKCTMLLFSSDAASSGMADLAHRAGIEAVML